MWYVFFAVLFLFSALVVFPYAYRKYGENRLRNECKEKKSIVLTFDDGPGKVSTPQILNLLDEFGANATFFMLGRELQENIEITQRIRDAEHEIGSHSFNHYNAWKTLPNLVHKDIVKGLTTSEQFGGSRWFRPPFGKLTLATLLLILSRNKEFAWWTVDSYDTWRKMKTPEQVVHEVKSKGGGVVLFHDNDRPEESHRTAFVLETVRLLLELAKQENYRVCTLGQLSDQMAASS